MRCATIASMGRRWIGVTGALLCMWALVVAQTPPTPTFGAPELVVGFPYVNYTFRSAAESEQYFSSGAYRLVMPAGVKVSPTGDVFVSVPRWKGPAVPATFNRLVSALPGWNASSSGAFPVPMPLLQPYPSWEMNAVGNPDTLQCVLGFEIDLQNRLWLLDQGQIGADPAIPGAIKLLVWDLVQNVSIRLYRFTPQVADPALSFLNDLVLDLRRGVAYISDAGNAFNLSRTLDELLPGLVVYDWESNSARRVLSGAPVVRANASFTFSIDGVPVLRSGPMHTGVDGIALTCDTTTLIFCPLTSQTLYAVSTMALRSPVLNEDGILSRVQVLGNKGTASDGLLATSDGGLLVTALELDAVLYAPQPLTPPLLSQLRIVAQNHSSMHWPDTMGIANGYLYFTADDLNNWADGVVPPSPPASSPITFRIWRVPVGTLGSYLRGCDSAGSPAVVVAVVASLLGCAVAVGLLVWLISECRGRSASRTADTASGLDAALMSPLYAGK